MLCWSSLVVDMPFLLPSEDEQCDTLGFADEWMKYLSLWQLPAEQTTKHSIVVDFQFIVYSEGFRRIDCI